jgi:DNA-binding response OmpR family regulator
MRKRSVDILLVEPDVELAGMIKTCLEQAISCSLTMVTDAATGLREELTTSHRVMIVSMNLPDAHWSELVDEIRRTNRAPFILLAENPSARDMLQALRLGAADVLAKPFVLNELAERVRQAETRAEDRYRRRVRNRRLRRLTSRIIRERRDLRQRMDLICKDFVQAYRRLAQRVSEADLLSHK